MTQINVLKIKNNANNCQALSFTCGKGQNVSVFSQGQGCNKNNQESKCCNGFLDNIFNMNPQDQASNNPMEKFFKAFLMGFMACLFGGMKNNQQKNNDNNNNNNILALINMPNEQKDDKCKMSKGFDFSQIEEAFKSLQNQGNKSKTTNYVFNNGVLSHKNRPETSSCGCSGTQPQVAEQSGCSGAQPQATEQNSSGYSGTQLQAAEQNSSTVGVSDFNVQDAKKAATSNVSSSEKTNETASKATKIHAENSVRPKSGSYAEALGKRESGGRYDIKNSYGYLGKYQMGSAVLKDLGYKEGGRWTGKGGIKSEKDFLSNPEAQEKAFDELVALQKKYIKNLGLDKYIGKTINGYQITESSLVAGTHLKGAGSVKKYLESNGQNNGKDAYGTSVESYMKKFSKYDV